MLELEESLDAAATFTQLAFAAEVRGGFDIFPQKLLPSITGSLSSATVPSPFTFLFPRRYSAASAVDLAAMQVPNESILTRTSTANSMDSSGTIQAPEDSDAETIDHGAHPDTSGGLSAPNEVSRDSAWAATPTLEVTLPGSGECVLAVRPAVLAVASGSF